MMIKKAKHSEQVEDQLGDPLIDIKNFTFAYETNPDVKIFRDLNCLIKKGDKIKIKGKSGVGKTTLYKLLTSAYPNIFNTLDKPFMVSFSSQHPMMLPDTKTVE